MSNRHRKIAGIIFLLILIISGMVLQMINRGNIGPTLALVGGLGFAGILVDWIHNKLAKPEGK
jgi:hypothetical protein